MVAIFAGYGAGLFRSSANILGSAGQLGSATQGRNSESVSINAATGNLLISQQDDFLVGRGLDIGISRTYNSQVDGADGDNGDQWQQSSYRRILNYVAGSSVKRQYADGSIVTYTWNASKNAFVTTDGDGAHDTLTFDGTTWTWTDGSSKVQELYSAYGSDNWRITQARDRLNNGTNTVTYSYVGDKLDKLTSADGAWLQYTWSGNNIVQITSGYTNLQTNVATTTECTSYTYDAYNRLSTVTVGNGLSYSTTYSYVGASKQIASISQSDGSAVSFAYDGSNRVISVTQTVASGDSRTTGFSYGPNYTSITGADGQVTTLNYDAATKQLTQVTAPPIGGVSQTVKYTYDASGNVLSVTDALNKVSTFTYDGNGNQLTAVNPNGSVTRTYDAWNNLLTETTIGSTASSASASLTTRYAYDAYNQLRYTVSAEGRVSEFYYNSYGQMYWQVDYPQAAYDVSGLAAGTSISETALTNWRNGFDNRAAQITYSMFDARGNVYQVNSYGKGTVGWGNADTAEGYSIRQYTYDQRGRLLSRNNYGEVAETFVYDSLDRLIGSTDLAGGTTSIVFNDAATQTVATLANGQVTTSTYNKAGDLISVTASSDWSPSTTTTYKYDKNGVLRMSTDGDGGNSYYLYDKAGRKTADINHYGWMTEYRYDADNRVVAAVKYLWSVPSGYLSTLADPNNTLDVATIRPTAHDLDKWTFTVYDAGGRVVQTIDGAGDVTAFTYDSSDRLIATTGYANAISYATVQGFKTTAPASPVAVSADSTRDRVTRSFYDRSGMLIGSLNAEGYLTENVYDKSGQLIEEIAYAQQTNGGYWATGTFDQLRSTISTTNAANRRVRHVYDGQGLERFTVNAQGGVVRMDYNVAGRLVQTTALAGTIAPADYGYESVKVAVANAANSANDRTSVVTYNSRGQVASTTDAGGLTTSFTYNVMGQVTKTVAGDRVTRNWYTQKGELRFTVDGEGYITEQGFDADSQLSYVIRYATPQSFDDNTSIGSVSAAVAADYNAGRYERNSFSYYANGQAYSATDGMGAQTITSLYGNEIDIDVYRAYGTPDQVWDPKRYDAAGRLQVKYAGWSDAEGAYTQYYYDGLSNLTAVTDPNFKTTYYYYDRLGRVTKMVDALGGETLFQYDAFGNQTATRDARGNWSYSNYDNLGRLSQATDALGYVTTSTYNTFGELLSVQKAGATTSFQYDKMGRVTRSTDALNFFETYTYNLFGDRISKTAKSSTTSVTAGGITNYTYDRRGLLLTEVLPMASYNSSGAVVSSTVTNKFEYDAYGNRTKMVEAYGLGEARTTQYNYDKNNRLIETIGQTFLGQTPHEYITYDARGNVTSTTNAAGGRSVFFYDDLDRKTIEINPAGTYTKYVYDKVGNVTEIFVYESVVGVPGDGGSEEEAPGAPGGASRHTTFAYDALNRMTSSSVWGAKSGVWNGSAWAASTSQITTTYQYDSVGNVVKLTDAYGNSVFSYYDAMSRKTSQVDADNYLTTWSYNADGNVTWESRYANRVAGSPVVGSSPGVTGSVDDRHTSFTYDANGNRLTETRHNVLVHNGGGAQAYASALIGYAYNGLGQVVRKTEATGDFVDYSYDAAGRLTQEVRKPFTDFTGASVTPTVDYYYDGVNNLSRTRQRGSGDSAERVTTYGYDGGKLRWLTDAEGNTRYYWYDVGGRQTYDYYTRLKSDGSADTSYNGSLTSYDAMGRVVSKWQADYAGNTWTTRGPVTQLTYNAFGDVTGTYIGGLLQQQNQYDLAGRLTGTTSGDGIWKYFGYDFNGNQTVAITSAGGSLGGSFDAAMGAVGSEGVNATYTVYNQRNLATAVVEEGRRFIAAGGVQNLTTTRSYTAFGEVAAETNAASATINYTYNTMGRMIRSESPAVEIVLENGTAQTVRPTEEYYYDVSGRLVATRDANGTYSGQTKNANTGNLTVLTLLTGTGYGGSQAQIVSELHGDGGVKQTKYDIHGDARVLVDEIGRQQTRAYDRMGRMVNAANGAGLVDYYTYDLLGQNLKHWNNQLGSSEVETTDYDIQGRVIAKRSFGGDVTSTSYAWDSTIATTGLGTFGGWLQTTTMANGLQSLEKSDLFGRVTWKRDLSGFRTTDYEYDIAGRMSKTSTNGMQVAFAWYNSGLQSSVVSGTPGAGQANTSWSRDVAQYGYSVTGNRLTEYFYKESGVYTPGHWEYQGGPRVPRYYGNYYNYYQVWVDESYYTTSTVVKNQTATYDALGRMKTWSEAGTATAPASSTATSYDANGNVRRTNANYYSLDASGAASYATTRDYWFRYDAMNRVVVNQGVLENGTITRGMGAYYGTGGGQDILYNAAGERTAVATTQAYYDGYGGYTANEVRENYTYNAAGRLTATYQATGAAVSGGYGTTPSVPSAGAGGTLRSAYYYDLMGHMTSQTDYDTNGYTAVYNRNAYYNTKGQLYYDVAWTKKTDGKTYQSVNNYYFTDYNTYQYMLGSVGWSQSTSTINGGSSVTSRTKNSYQWWDGAVQSGINHQANISQSATFNTTFYLNSYGQLTGAYIADGKPRSISFTLDENGQIIRRDEYGAISGQTGNPHEVWYRFTGRQMGYTGNNGTSEISYEASIGERRTVTPSTQGTFRNSSTYGTSYADFAQNYDPINSYYQGSAGGSYRVNQGDTLQGIAQSLYGDSSLWYKIAEANGLSAGAALTEGQTLVLPAGVLNSKNNTSTLKPYNAAEATGDLSPTMAKPPKKAKCGGFGMILLAVVAIAVATIVTAGAASLMTGATFSSSLGAVFSGGIVAGFGTATTALTTIGAAGALATGAIAGSIVSQAVGVATGIQEKFSWKGVALAGIGAFVGGAITGVFGKATNAFGSAARAAAGSAITQGIGVATGLQDKFSWAGVAAAGVGAAVGHEVAGMAGKAGHAFAGGLGLHGGTYLRVAEGVARSLGGAAEAIANAATRSAIEGSSFGDNVVAALPDIIANALQAAVSACFTGDTLIHTPNGLKTIKQIRVGDYVYSRDESFVDERVQPRRVIELYRFENRSTLDVIIAFDAFKEETIRATKEHPFAVIENSEALVKPARSDFGDPLTGGFQPELLAERSVAYSWQVAADLRPGDRVVDISGRIGTVVAIEPVAALSTVYNFAVEQHHTYFVGLSGTWVHNQYGAAAQAILEGAAVSPTELANMPPAELAATISTLKAMAPEVAASGDHNLISSYRETAQNILIEEISRRGKNANDFLPALLAGAAEGFAEFFGDGWSAVKTLWNDPGKVWDAALGLGGKLLDGWRAATNKAGDYLTGNANLFTDARDVANWLIDQANMVTAGVLLDAAEATHNGGIEGLSKYIGKGIGYTVGSMVAGGVAGKAIQLGGRALSAGLAEGFAAGRKLLEKAWDFLGFGVSGAKALEAVKGTVGRILSGNGTHKLKEALGLVRGVRLAREQGFEYLGELTYSSNNGIDGLLFNSKSGQYAFLETKGGAQSSLRDLRTYGYRQGSEAYNDDRLRKFIASAEDGPMKDHARLALAQLEHGKTLSFASFRATNSLYRLDPTPDGLDFTGVKVN